MLVFQECWLQTLNQNEFVYKGYITLPLHGDYRKVCSALAAHVIFMEIKLNLQDNCLHPVSHLCYSFSSI